MIDGSEKRNPQLAFELQNSHVCEKRSKQGIKNRNSVLNRAGKSAIFVAGSTSSPEDISSTPLAAKCVI